MKKCSYCGKDVKNYYRVFFGNCPRITIRKCGRYFCRFRRWLGILTFEKAVENVNKNENSKAVDELMKEIL